MHVGPERPLDLQHPLPHAIVNRVTRLHAFTPGQLVSVARDVVDELFKLGRRPVRDAGVPEGAAVGVSEGRVVRPLAAAVLPRVEVAALRRPQQHEAFEQRVARVGNRLEEVDESARRGRGLEARRLLLLLLPDGKAEGGASHRVLEVEAVAGSGLGEEAQLAMDVAEGAEEHVHDAPLEALLVVVDKGVWQLDFGQQGAREANVRLHVDPVLAQPLRERAARDAALARKAEERHSRRGVEGRHVRLQQGLREGHDMGGGGGGGRQAGGDRG